MSWGLFHLKNIRLKEEELPPPEPIVIDPNSWFAQRVREYQAEKAAKEEVRQ